MRQLSRGKENMPPVMIDMPQRKASPSGNQDLSGSPGRDGLTGYPIKEESVYAMQTTPDGKQIRVSVILKVYANNFGGRYAVVSQDRVMCRDSGYINLNHCVVKSRDISKSQRTGKLQDATSRPGSSTHASQFCFEIVSQKIDGQRLMFMVSTRVELEQWLSVLTDPEQDYNESRSPQVIIGSPIRRCIMGQISQSRAASPRLSKKQCQTLMPALAEEE